MVEELRFSHTYDKLYDLNDGHQVTTIRRRDKFQFGDKVKVMTNGRFLCYAQIKSTKKLQILKIDTADLIQDVSPHADTREEAIAFISSFYTSPMTEDSVVFLYRLKRISESQVITKITQLDFSEKRLPEGELTSNWRI